MALVAKDPSLRIERLQLGPFGTNAYVVVCQATGESVVVDAPAESGKILESLQATTPRNILITHSHFDHLQALPELRARLGVPVAAHSLDAAGLPFPPEVMLNDGDIITCGKVQLTVLHTPGHTPGSVCFLTGRYLIAGDTIFPGGPGKTGTPPGLRQIIESITGKIFVLPDDTYVYPGHGDSTVLGREKAAFAAFASRSHDPGLCGDVLWLSS